MPYMKSYGLYASVGDLWFGDACLHENAYR